MIGNNLSPHHGRRFHMDAAGPSLAAITRVHLKNKDIQSAIGRKFNGNPNDTTTFITALDTLVLDAGSLRFFQYPFQREGQEAPEKVRAEP